ncbi:hypothetical protein AX14_004248 [Amanita brunnescens Koide BX004]|nr:hypothetical protein AX14_004248 [Amanita brunnescens Koide BX004]
MPLAYPSPPSPAEDTGHGSPLHETMDLLESLVDFYEEEQLWVDRIRAGLVGMTSTAPGVGDTQHVDAASEQNDQELHPTRRSRWVNRLDSRPDTRKERILEQFGQLIEARLESCQRVNELLQQAMRSRNA